MASSQKKVLCPVSHLGCEFSSSSVEDSVRHYKKECKFGPVFCTNCGKQVNLFSSLHSLKQWCTCKATSPSQDQQGQSKSVLEQLQSVQEEQRSFREWMKEWTAGLETRMMKTVEEIVNTKLCALTERMEDLSRDVKLVQENQTHLEASLKDTNAVHEDLLARLNAATKVTGGQVMTTLQEFIETNELALRNVEKVVHSKFDMLSKKVDEVKEEIPKMASAVTLTELDSVVKTSNAALQNLLTKPNADFLAVEETQEDNVRKIDHVSETAFCAKQGVEDLAEESSDLEKSVEEVKKLASEIPGIKEGLERVEEFVREVPAFQRASAVGTGEVTKEGAKESSETVPGEQRSWIGRVGTWVQDKTVFWYIENISKLIEKEESISSPVEDKELSMVGHPFRMFLSLHMDGNHVRISIRETFSHASLFLRSLVNRVPCIVTLIHPEDAHKNKNVVAELVCDRPVDIFGWTLCQLRGGTTLCTVEEARREGFIMHDAICVSIEHCQLSNLPATCD